MKTRIIILALLCGCFFAQAQTKATTENGKKVILYKNKTWLYQSELDALAKGIKTNSKKYTKSQSASYLLKSKILNVGVWVNPEKWEFGKHYLSNEFEYRFKLKGTLVSGFLVTDKTFYPLAVWRKKGIENTKKIIPEYKVIKEEYRQVNGIKVLCMIIQGSWKGMKQTFFNYYFTNAQGSVEFNLYTSSDEFEQYKKACEELLNGLTEIK